MDTAELHWRILRYSWLAVLVGIVIEALVVLTAPVPPQFLTALIVSSSLPLLAVTLWVRFRPGWAHNRYLVSAGLMAAVAGINYSMGDIYLFYLFLFVQATVVLYLDRRLLAGVTLLGIAFYSGILVLHPHYLTWMAAYNHDVISSLASIYAAFIIGAIFFDALSRHLILQAQLAHLADHDALTGIFNRRRFHHELTRHINYASRYGSEGAVLFLDLDNFKCVNDNLGHRAGDEFLTTWSRLLRKQLRETDILARLGGDEFTILLPQADAAKAQAVAEKILEADRDGRHAVMVDGQSVNISVCIGIARFPDHGKTVEELLTHADLAMYRAKKDGPNRIYMYSPDQPAC